MSYIQKPESLCNWPCPLPVRKFFCKITKTGKPTFSNSSLGFCPICVKLGMYTHRSHRSDLKLSKEFCSVNVINTKFEILGCHEAGKGWVEFGKFWPLGGAKNMGSLCLLNSYTDFYENWSVWCRANSEAISSRWSWLVNVGMTYYKINNKYSFQSNCYAESFEMYMVHKE